MLAQIQIKVPLDIVHGDELDLRKYLNRQSFEMGYVIKEFLDAGFCGSCNDFLNNRCTMILLAERREDLN